MLMSSHPSVRYWNKTLSHFADWTYFLLSRRRSGANEPGNWVAWVGMSLPREVDIRSSIVVMPVSEVLRYIWETTTMRMNRMREL